MCTATPNSSKKWERGKTSFSSLWSFLAGKSGEECRPRSFRMPPKVGGYRFKADRANRLAFFCPLLRFPQDGTASIIRSSRHDLAALDTLDFHCRHFALSTDWHHCRHSKHSRRATGARVGGADPSAGTPAVARPRIRRLTSKMTPAPARNPGSADGRVHRRSGLCVAGAQDAYSG